MPDLAAVPWDAFTAGGLGLSGLALLGVYMFFNGKIVHRSYLDDARDDRDQWRTAHARSEESRGLLLEELRRTTTALERITGSKDLSVALLRSVRKEAPGAEQEAD